MTVSSQQSLTTEILECSLVNNVPKRIFILLLQIEFNRGWQILQPVNLKAFNPSVNTWGSMQAPQWVQLSEEKLAKKTRNRLEKDNTCSEEPYHNEAVLINVRA